MQVLAQSLCILAIVAFAGVALWGRTAGGRSVLFRIFGEPQAPAARKRPSRGGSRSTPRRRSGTAGRGTGKAKRGK